MFLENAEATNIHTHHYLMRNRVPNLQAWQPHHIRRFGLASYSRNGAASSLGMWLKETGCGVLIFITLCAIMQFMMIWLTGDLLTLFALPMFEIPFILGYFLAKEKPR